VDLLDFDGEPMYFDQPLNPEAEALITEAADHYGEERAQHSLLRAYFLEPEHLTVLVALYRYFYYRHQYADALIVAERATTCVARQLNLPTDWRSLSRADLGHAVLESMSLTRFLLLALKGAGFLLLRLDQPALALERFEKVVEMDTSDRLGMNELVAMARARLARQRVGHAGGKVSYFST
jgi:hypothetical protein